MMSFDTLDVCSEIKDILKPYNVSFVFQPIFTKDETLVGYEALMRPKDKNIMEFISEMENENRLHELELLSFFGATMEYKNRNYDKLLSINSFPSEAFSEKEASEYSRCFRPIKDKLVIEILEYTEEKYWTWDAKKKHLEDYRGIEVALDDYGTGNNDSEAVDFYCPQMIKLARNLISGIDKDISKQERIKSIVSDMHMRTIAVLAEGVETKEEFNYLKSIDVDFYQGYYLGRPA